MTFIVAFSLKTFVYSWYRPSGSEFRYKEGRSLQLGGREVSGNAGHLTGGK